MIIPTIIMGTLAIGLLAYGYNKGLHVDGMKMCFRMLVQVLPVLFFAFVIAGMVQALVAAAATARWVGADSGLRGILIGSVAGALTPGSTLFTLPLMAALLRSGAAVATMVSFMTSWSVFHVMRLPLEIGVLGWKFTLVRLVSSVLLPLGDLRTYVLKKASTYMGMNADDTIRLLRSNGIEVESPEQSLVDIALCFLKTAEIHGHFLPRECPGSLGLGLRAQPNGGRITTFRRRSKCSH